MRKIAVALVGIVTSLAAVEARPQPDFSGTWTLVKAPGLNGGTVERGRRGGAGSGSIVTNVASGAAFNCGGSCTVVQDAAVLAVAGATTYQGQPLPGARIALDGSSAPQTTTRWDGDRLVIERLIADRLRATQTLSIQDGRLIVVTRFAAPNDMPVTFEYAKQ
jgi:hypothetical protein